jgi:hypothetical protein
MIEIEAQMGKFLLGIGILALSSTVTSSATAQVSVSVGVDVEPPPEIAFSAPPDVVVLPETTGVYVVPEAEHDIYFWNGFWWRPWGGRWFRSRNYDRGWAHYRAIPEFYGDVDPQWRTHYHDRSWYGHPWEYRRIAHGDLQHNWRQWHNNRYWAGHGNWGVQGYTPRPRREWERIRAERRERSRDEFQRNRPETHERPARAPDPRYRAPEHHGHNVQPNGPMRPENTRTHVQPQSPAAPDAHQPRRVDHDRDGHPRDGNPRDHRQR